jgi:cAMP phosphodiesterase
MNIKEDNFKFQNAKFDDKRTKKQSYIVTSVGQYLITWRLVDVIIGKVDKYQVKFLG